MKRSLSLFAASALFFAVVGLTNVFASTNKTPSSTRAIAVTGCLEPGPVAKEYIVQGNDGKAWGVNEKDLMLNNYVGKTVTVAGDPTHATLDERKSGGASHYMLARDVVVDSKSCQE